jgi:uncharacterized protein YsxB (DUF464 family)
VAAMIRVKIERQLSNGFIRSFAIKGHADFAKHGQDIVCAGVSAVSVGTVNAAETLLDIVMPSEMKNGFLQAAAPETLDELKQEKLQLLLESMVVMLKNIEDMYGSYIKIEETVKKRR